MASEKELFLRACTVLIDTREKDNGHILRALDALGVRYEPRKLDIGDLSFTAAGRDFSLSCAIERKAGVDELYANLTEAKKGGRGRLEKELDAARRTLRQFSLLIEGVESMEALRAYTVPAWQMQAAPRRVRADIGAPCYAALRGENDGAAPANGAAPKRAGNKRPGGHRAGYPAGGRAADAGAKADGL